METALAYPGPQVRRPALLTEAGAVSVGGATAGVRVGALWDEWEAVLRAAGGAPLQERSWLVAIGSNGSATSLRDKLAGRRVSCVVPLLPAVIVGIGAAHSAHVSLGGYVAAAPHAAPPAATHGVVGLVDPDQLTALDESEPNYRRVSVASSRYPVSALGSPLPFPARYQVYRSVWGVLAREGHVVSLRSQPAVHRLMRSDHVLARVLPLGDPDAAVRSLSQPMVQAFVRDHWRLTGASVADGLADA